MTTITIDRHHAALLQDLLNATPDSERARELRVMIGRLEQIKPDLERRRIAEMEKRLETSHA